MRSLRPRRSLAARALSLGAPLLLWLGCHGDDVVAPGTGRIEVTVSTAGEEPDADGYTLSLDGLQAVRIEAVATRTLEVEEGNHTLELAGLAGNCAVAAPGPGRTVTITAGGTVPVAFEVNCNATTGGIRVVTATAGDALDPDGYAVTLDQGGPRPLGVHDTLEVTALEAGDHEVRLTGLADNCTVADGDTRTAAVTAGAIAEVTFTVTCVSGVNRWTAMESGTAADLSDAWGTGAADVFAVGEIGTEDASGFHLASVVIHYDGIAWALQRRIRDISLRGVWGSSPADVWAVGFGFLDDDARVLHYDGTQWVNVPGFGSPGDESFGLVAVWGSSATDVFTVGSAFDGEFSLSLIFHYDGHGWERMPVTGDVLPGLSDVWGSGPADVYAVGRDQVASPAEGVVLHYDGHGWTPVLQEVGLNLTSVWGSSASDVFAAGFTVEEVDNQFVVAGAIRHFDGQGWTPMQVPATGVLQDLWGTSAADVFAVGDDGVILHYDGAEWTATNPTDRSLLGVWGSAPADVFAVGNQGIILHGTP